MGIPEHLTCLLRNLYADQEATIITGHGPIDRFQIGKGVCQGCILSPCLFNLYAEYIMRNAGLDEAQAGIKIVGRNIKITADGDCSHEIKRCLLLGRKVITSLDSILNCRHITLPKMVQLVKAMFFPVVMYGCESWTTKKAEHQRTDAFELWC